MKKLHSYMPNHIVIITSLSCFLLGLISGGNLNLTSYSCGLISIIGLCFLFMSILMWFDWSNYLLELDEIKEKNFEKR